MEIANRSRITLVHYAWVITVVTALVLLAAAGIRTAPQVLIKPLEHEFGWMRADISFPIAISILWYGLGGLAGGTLVDRLGLRRVMGLGLTLIASGLIGVLNLSALWQMHVFYGLGVGIGTGMLANVLGAVVAQRWFVRHRGLIVGLFSAGSATGQLIFLPSMISLNAAYGWRGAITAAATAIGVLIVPVILFMRERPSDVHQRPYGEQAASAEQGAKEDALRTSVLRAIGTRDFWLLAGSFFVCGYTTNGLIGTHLLPHALEHGFTDTVAGGAIAVMGALNVIGTFGSGWLSDRVDNRRLLGLYYGFRAFAIAVLPFVQDLSGLLIFAVVYGLDWMATVPPTINLIAQRFGRASVGVLYGWIFFTHMIGASAAAFIAGLLRDRLGDYTIAFLSAAVMALIAVGLVVNIRRVQVTAARTA